MDFRIADTFTDSLARLTRDEQKAAKITAIDLQMDPSSPGLQFHRIDKSKDPNFWSLRVNRDLRIVVHRTAGSILLSYVGHHDKAYAGRSAEGSSSIRARARSRSSRSASGSRRSLPPRVPAEAAPVTPVDCDVGRSSACRRRRSSSVGVPEDWTETIRAA